MQQQQVPSVAVLGTGKMGAAIARRLDQRGFKVSLWNRTRARADAVGIGEVHDTAAEAAGSADVVISILTGPEAVREAYLGENGVLAGVTGQLFIDMTTAGPDVAPELEAELGRLGSALLEAPVLGSIGAIEAGRLLILVGGAEGDLARARTVLDALGEIKHIGPLGSANRLKLTANSMLAGVSSLAAELQAAGVAAGLRPEDVFFVLQRISPLLEARRAGYLDHRYGPVSFALRDMLKDVSLALELFKGAGADVPQLEAVGGLYSDVAREHGDDEMSAINERFGASRGAAGNAPR